MAYFLFLFYFDKQHLRFVFLYQVNNCKDTDKDNKIYEKLYIRKDLASKSTIYIALQLKELHNNELQQHKVKVDERKLKKGLKAELCLQNETTICCY